MASTETTDLDPPDRESNEESRPRLKLKWLRIDKFRDIEPGTTLHFDDQRVVLLGRNGTGKTTLLELILACVEGRFGQFPDESIDVDFGLALGNVELNLRLTNERRYWLGRPGERISPYTSCLRWTPPDAKNALEVHKEGGMITLAYALGGWLEKCLSQTESSLVDLFQDSAIAARRLDEALRAYDQVFGEYTLSIYTDEDGSGGTVRSVMPTGVLSRSIEVSLADSLHAEPAVETLVLDTESNSMFLAIRRLLGATRIEATLDLAESTGDVMTFGPLELLVWRDGRGFRHDMMSFGEKRLVAALLHIFSDGDFVLADELVNGMHYDWIRECLELIGDKQAFLASQNPLLLDHLTFDSVEQVKNTFIRCTLEGDDEKRWVWRNFTDAEAREFFEAYEAGFQQVGEILRVHGLW